MVFNPEKLAKFRAKAASARTGGKGSVRRKHKAVRKAATHDDKRLISTLNRLNVRDIPAIEEVNLFKEDGHVIHFVNPKVKASIAANTYVVSGTAETKKLQDLLPGIITQLGPDNLEYLKRIYSTMGDKTAKPTDEEEIPELVDTVNFEDVSKNKTGDEKKTDEKSKAAALSAAAAAVAASAPSSSSTTASSSSSTSTTTPSTTSTTTTPATSSETATTKKDEAKKDEPKKDAKKEEKKSSDDKKKKDEEEEEDEEEEGEEDGEEEEEDN